MGRFKVGYCGKRRSLLGRFFEKILELTPTTTLLGHAPTSAFTFKTLCLSGVDPMVSRCEIGTRAGWLA